MGRIVGIDFGERRIGIAVSDAEEVIAMPHAVLDARDSGKTIEGIRRICDEVSAERCVVGMPYSLDGSEGPAARKVEEFVQTLKSSLTVPVDSWDERFTSTIADNAFREANYSEKKRRPIRDKVAAQIILQSYLDSRSNQTPGGECSGRVSQ